MQLRTRLFRLACFVFSSGPLFAQMLFYTDNVDVTNQGTLRFEFFNEFDGLQSAQVPNLRQNTFNYKANYGQGPGGGQYQLNSRMAITFALLFGSHIASPREGGQFGFEIDFPLRGRSPAKQCAFNQPSTPAASRRSP